VSLITVLVLLGGCQKENTSSPQPAERSPAEASKKKAPLIEPVEGPVTPALAAKTLAPLMTRAPATPVAIEGDVLEIAKRVTSEPGDLPRLKLRVDGETYPLPLRHTHVNAALSGDVARVEIEQTYENPFGEAIETVYVFPLPENSAVDAMRMVIGDRVVEAEIKKQNAAKQIYDVPRNSGHTAAMQEQDCTNICTHPEPNIAPHSYLQDVFGYVQEPTDQTGALHVVSPWV